MKKKLNCILLIDDDEVNNVYSKIIIEGEKCASHVTEKKTVKEALDYLVDSGETIESKKLLPFPDLIFLDINMPVQDGWDFLQLYHEIKDNFIKNPIIIMVSSSCDLESKLRAKGISEVSDIYVKPLTMEIVNLAMTKYFPEYV